MTVSDTTAARVREVRKRRGWQPADLASRCAELGRRSGGKRRRAVTVDELLALALALNVAPVHLLVPPDDSDEPYQITQTVTATSRFNARAWIRGVFPLSGDRRDFDTEAPQHEYYSPGRVDAPPLQGQWMSPEEDS
jgi:transcriptional regulator with XRE-family HTH domain